MKYLMTLTPGECFQGSSSQQVGARFTKKKIGALSQWVLVQMDMVKVNSQERRKRKRTGGREEGGEWIGLGFDSHG